jgi:hypothetical protein
MPINSTHKKVSSWGNLTSPFKKDGKSAAKLHESLIPAKPGKTIKKGGYDGPSVAQGKH